MNQNICCIFNIAPHYRAPIYNLMAEHLNCDFFIGDKGDAPVKLMDYKKLKGFQKILKYIPLVGNFYFQKNAFPLVFKPYSYYIITGEPYCLSTWLILFFAKISGKKILLWTHGWYGVEGQVKKTIKKIFFGLSSKILLYGEYARNLMIEEGFKPNKLTCIYNSLDYNLQLKVRKKLTLNSVYTDYFNNSHSVIIYIGRIQKSKKLDLLFNAVSQLNNNNTLCNLILIGGETDDFSVDNEIKKYELKGKVWNYGPCYDEYKLGELIYNATVCVSPGFIGLTAIHSLVYGTPAITHNNFKKQAPEFEAITENMSGSFFEEDSIVSLVEHIEKWITISPSKREQVRKTCFKVIDNKYTPQNQIKILEKTIDKMSNKGFNIH